MKSGRRAVLCLGNLFPCSLASLLLFLSVPSWADTVLVQPGDVWQFRKGTSAPQADWKTAPDSGLDNTWLSGPGGLGYADNTAETALCNTLLPDMKGNYTSVALRRSFEVVSAIDPAWQLQLTMDYDDGFIAWLDGAYLASANAPSAPSEPAFNAIAPTSHESSRGNNGANPEVTYNLGPASSKLAHGTHVLAILGLNQSTTSSDFIQIATLALTTNGVVTTNCLSGFLASDTTLQAAKSPYQICGDLTVGTGVTLTIEPGTVVQLLAGVNVTVADGGKIIAEGTENARIQFTRVPGGNAWGGITISGTGNSPETRLAYVDFEGNGTVCLEVAGGTLYLDHAGFATTSHQYVSLDASSFLISHCYFPSSTAAFELLHGNGGIKAGGRGIVRDCFFGTTSGYNDIMDFTGGNRPNQPLIQYYNNVFTGASDDILDIDGTDAWIEGNIFLHSHKNGAPDSSAAISGGNFGGATSEITIIGNLFFDCDQSATAKQGNFYTMINNTIVHMTRSGGLDTADGVVNVRDLDPGPPTTFGLGYYLEANVVTDAEQLVRNYDPQQTTVTFINNILPLPWSGPGMSNIIADPLFKHVPLLSETYFTNWTDAQVLWDWFSLLPGSPALGTGPNGRDKGGVIPLGVSISGEPNTTTTNTGAALVIGINRSGNGIPATSWTRGAGFTDYEWQLDGGPWSAETPVTNSIVLTNLAPGTHQVAVVGKNDVGFYQNDPELGTNAVVTLSRPWTVLGPDTFLFTDVQRSGGSVTLHFVGAPAKTYRVESKDSLSASTWSTVSTVTTDSATGAGAAIDPNAITPARFYRLTAP